MSENLPATITTRPPSVFSGESAFESGQRMARALCSSTMVPQEYRGDNGLPNAMIALEMAQRIGASPMAVMQNMHVIHGRPSWSSSFIIASLNSCGRFSPIRFDVSGVGDQLTCVAWAYDATGEKLTGPPVSIKMAKDEGWYGKNGSKWKTMPELMLRYRAAAFFGRLYAPDILMGMHSDDEVQDIGPQRMQTVEATTDRPALVTEVEEVVEPKQEPKPTTQPDEQETVDQAGDPIREKLKAELDKRGIKYGNRQRTETLQQLLDDAIDKECQQQHTEDVEPPENEQHEEPPPLAEPPEEEPQSEQQVEPGPEKQQKPIQLF